MKIISCLFLLAGLAAIALAVLMQYMNINFLGAGRPTSYLVLANTLMLLGIAAAMHKKS